MRKRASAIGFRAAGNSSVAGRKCVRLILRRRSSAISTVQSSRAAGRYRVFTVFLRLYIEFSQKLRKPHSKGVCGKRGF